MRPYLAILSARFRMLLQYRSAAIAGFVTQLFWGLIRMMIFLAFLENAVSPPLSAAQTVGYIWLTQAFLLLCMVGGDAEVQGLIRSGNVAYELLRPVDLYGLWFSRMVAGRIAPTLLRCMPQLIIASLAGWLYWPGFAAAGAFAAAIFGALLLSSAIGVLLTTTVFWTLSGVGINRVVSGTTFLLSGFLIPLPLLPDSWQKVIAMLPFRGLADAPFRLFLGHIPPRDVVWVLLHQLIWTLVLAVFTRWLIGRSLRRVVVQGG